MSCLAVALTLALAGQSLAGATAAVGEAAQAAAKPEKAQAATTPDAAVDKIFASWSDSTPGCAVAVSRAGSPLLSRAYGMADLEHGVRNTPETIFEAGSVAKQFTAAAVLLLAHDGKLSLDDPVRRYIPELPDYGAPLTIRHMLTHTSGLRDWGSVAGISGWPRTTRAYTHAHVLEIVGRQSALNFPPGTRYSYSNTGYNLAAILVARVSGMSFAEFSQKRIFEPVGMTHTSWRDDHRRVVKGRAIAHSPVSGGFQLLMPFEHVHGNGGLLTTVGDLLKWNDHFAAPRIADAAFVHTQQTAGTFNDGRTHGYALGLSVGKRGGLTVIEHSGSTAGYVAHLSRYPEQKLSVAVLCNVSSGNATQSAIAVAGAYLGDQLTTTAAAKATHALSAGQLYDVVGAYRGELTGEMISVTASGEGVRVDAGPPFIPVSATRFVAANGNRLEWDGSRLRVTDIHGSVEEYARVERATPSPAALQLLTGRYASEDAETILTVAVEDGALVLKRRPDSVIRLRPLYTDAFAGPIGTVIFRRQGSDVVGLSVVQDRVWDLRFARESTTSSARQPQRAP